MNTTTPTHVYEISITATPERVWAALVEPDLTERYYFGSRFECDSLSPGSTYRYTAGGAVLLTGELLEVDPPRRLVSTFSAMWDDGVAADRPSRMTWAIEPDSEGTTRVRVLHDGFDDDTETSRQVAGGLPELVGGLKQLLESEPADAGVATNVGG